MPVHFTIEKPLVALTLTVEFIEPSVFEEPWPFAFQFQLINPFVVDALSFAGLPVPTVKPSEVKAEMELVELFTSAELLSDWIYFPTPLTASTRQWLLPLSLSLTQTKSGWNSNPVTVTADELPKYIFPSKWSLDLLIVVYAIISLILLLIKQYSLLVHHIQIFLFHLR